MASHLKIGFVSCLLLFILMEEFKPVLAIAGQPLKQRTKKLEASVAELKAKIKALEECKACSKIQELNNTINELREKVDSQPASVAAGLGGSEIMKRRDPSYQRALANILKPVMQSNSRWRRCWRASSDGWAATTFHSLCDDKGPTVTIVRVGQYIFGAYTSRSWSNSCRYHYDPAAFLFSVVNKPGWQPLKLDQVGRTSIYSCSRHGPSFGIGHDLHIADSASTNTKSYSLLGYTFRLSSGYSPGSSFAESFLAGSKNFQPDEVEVFYETT
ncbi:uncharacterized protein LOC144664794 isoform X1 [Oculina patagonica]